MATTSRHDYGRLEKSLVALLAEGRPLSVAQLEHRLKTSQRRYSIQAIYHVLRKLRRQGVVMRVRTRFSLSLAWALDLLDLARRIEQRVLLSTSAAEVVPEAGQMFRWRFSSVIALDDFWIHLMLLLLERAPTRRIYNFCPHPWFYYAHQAQLSKFYEVLRRRQARIRLAVGGISFLDKLFVRSTSQDLYSCIHAEGGAVGGGMNKHVMVIGDYVIEVLLRRAWAMELHSLFLRTNSTSHRDMQPLHRLFQQSTPSILRVSNSPTKALRLQKRFTRLFGGEE